MRKLIKIVMELEGSREDITTILIKIYETSELKEVVSLTSSTLDTFQGKWTEPGVIKMGGRMLRIYPYVMNRKAKVQKE